MLSCNIWLIPLVGFFFFFLSCGCGFLVQLDKFDICLYIWLILPVGYLCLNFFNFKLNGENYRGKKKKGFGFANKRFKLG